MEDNQELDLLQEFPPHSYEEWKRLVEESLKGADFNKVMFTKTYEGITLQPIYRKEDIAGLPHLDALPGQAPYPRGTETEGWGPGGWIVAQKQDNPSLETLNQELLDELNRGLNCLNLSLHPDSRAGRFPRSGSGIPLSHLLDMKALLKGIELEAVPIYLFGEETVILHLSLLNAYAKVSGKSIRKLAGCAAFDPVAIQFTGSGGSDRDRNLQLAAQLTTWADFKAPRIRTLLMDGVPYENAGASAVQELAFAFASGLNTISALLDKGLSIEQIAPRFILRISLGANFFLEIAKVRAARMIWAEIIKAHQGSEKAQKLFIHGVSAGFNKTTYDIYVNILRSATEGFAGVIGGVDSLELGTFDHLVRQQSTFSKRIARNQQIILAEEAHFTKVQDPAGGCYYIEKLTAQIAEQTWQLLQTIESEGGILAWLDSGKLASEIVSTARLRIDNIHKRRDIVVGVNMYANPEEAIPAVQTPDDAWLQEAGERLQELRKLSTADLDSSLGYLKDNPDNDFLVDMIADAWIHNADIEQISTALGLQKTPLSTKEPLTAVKDLELLRSKILSHQGRKDILLLNMGPLAQHKARADFSLGFLQVGGFQVVNPSGYPTVEEAITAVKQFQPQAVCICSTDDSYPELVPALCSALKSLPHPPLIMLAGYPADQVESHKKAGVKVFIHLRANIFDTLSELAREVLS